MSTLEDAIHFAIERHAGQTRKAFDVPFICHPLAVLSRVMAATTQLETHQAAVLHDVIEDTNTTLIEVQELFGDEVTSLVLFMTQDKSIKNYYERRLNAVAKLYKLLDSVPTLYDNLDKFVLKISDNIDNIDSFTQLIKRYGTDLKKPWGFDMNRTTWYLDELATVYQVARDNLDPNNYDEFGRIRIRAFYHLHDTFVSTFSAMKQELYGGNSG